MTLINLLATEAKSGIQKETSFHKEARTHGTISGTARIEPV